MSISKLVGLYGYVWHYFGLGAYLYEHGIVYMPRSPHELRHSLEMYDYLANL